MSNSLVTVVSGRHGSVGEWLFSPARVDLRASNPDDAVAEGLGMLADVVVPALTREGLIRDVPVVLTWTGADPTTHPSLEAARQFASERWRDAGRAPNGIALSSPLLIDGRAELTIPDGLRVTWHWPARHSIQIKVFCDAFLPNRIGGEPNEELAKLNQARLERALSAIHEALHGEVEIGDDEMPWATAEGFRLDNRRERDGEPIDGRLGFPEDEFSEVGTS